MIVPLPYKNLRSDYDEGQVRSVGRKEMHGLVIIAVISWLSVDNGTNNCEA